MACPYVHRVTGGPYANRVHLCRNPARMREIIVLSLRELRTRCLTDAGFRKCPLFPQARPAAPAGISLRQH